MSCCRSAVNDKLVEEGPFDKNQQARCAPFTTIIIGAFVSDCSVPRYRILSKVFCYYCFSLNVEQFSPYEVKTPDLVVVDTP